MLLLCDNPCGDETSEDDVTRAATSAATLVALLGTAGLAAGGPACPPAVRLSGDEGGVERVRRALARRGIETHPASGCPAPEASIQSHDGAITVRIAATDGRSDERTMAQPDAAAAWIESWARPDLSAGLLEGFSDPAGAPTSPGAATIAARARPVATARVALSLSAETSLATDGTLLVGGALAGCARWGPLCVGGLGRLAAAPGERASDAELLLSADLPRRLGAGTLDLGVAAGYGWAGRWATAQEGSDKTIDRSASGPRLELHAGYTIPLARRLWLDLGASASLSPLADTGPEPKGDQPVPGEPLAHFRVGAGVRLGLP